MFIKFADDAKLAGIANFSKTGSRFKMVLIGVNIGPYPTKCSSEARNMGFFTYGLKKSIAQV